MKNLSKLFKDKEMLNKALTHKSWVNENRKKRRSNERLEFLGDAILEFVVSNELYERFPNKEEGYLTALRANIVNTKNLASVSKELGIGEMFFLSKGEEETGGRVNNSLLADTLEAVIGALYLDSGLNSVSEFIIDNILKDLDKKVSEPLKDPKSRLQELVQSKGFHAPRYRVISAKGPDHNKEFVIEAKVNGTTLAEGKGKSKSEAARNAADNSLQLIAKNKAGL